MGIILTEDAIIAGSSDSWERNQKEKEYLDYITNHINSVKKAYELYFIPLLSENFISTIISTEELHNAIENVGESIQTHDASKFSDSEFDAYRAKYYPTQIEKNASEEYNVKVYDDYQIAWKHHYETNIHHPENWVIRNEDGKIVEIKDMSLEAIIEMICDWEGMSLMFHDTTTDWYTNRATDEKECMSARTKEIVEELLFKVIHH